MGILGIKSTTENWKTAQSFAPFSNSADARQGLAQRLLDPLNEDLNCEPEQVQIELFWNGMRDYLKTMDEWRRLDRQQEKIEKFGPIFATLHDILHPNLRTELLDYQKMFTKNSDKMVTREFHYTVHGEEANRKLYHVLHGTEFDVVLEAPGYFFVGEAKLGGNFNDNDKGVFRHQLVKEYLVANITLRFLEERGNGVRVVPFVVAEECQLAKLKNERQTEFMVSKGWLHPQNILSWGDIEKLASAT